YQNKFVHLRNLIKSFKDSKLEGLARFIHKDVINKGIGYHHAGMDIEDRQKVETLFLNGLLSVVHLRYQLAFSINFKFKVNLPAHLVIIKSTSQYVNGKIGEYNSTQINQMIGRAGRPQFDTEATAVILTNNQLKTKYEGYFDESTVTESSLHLNLADRICCEIINETIFNLQSALIWIKSTFMYIRMKLNPQYYGFLK
ncbi:hypothetical protein HZS_7487, partial [Henneguya salminicola]